MEPHVDFLFFTFGCVIEGRHAFLMVAVFKNPLEANGDFDVKYNTTRKKNTRGEEKQDTIYSLCVVFVSNLGRKVGEKRDY